MVRRNNGNYSTVITIELRQVTAGGNSRSEWDHHPGQPLVLAQACHDSRLGGHFGATKTIDLVSRHYWWRTWRQDVKNYVASCDTCQRTKVSRTLTKGLLQPMPTGDRPFAITSVDFIGSSGHFNQVFSLDPVSKGTYSGTNLERHSFDRLSVSMGLRPPSFPI